MKPTIVAHDEPEWWWNLKVDGYLHSDYANPMNQVEAKAKTVAKEVALFLKEKYGATRVLLFGSLAKCCFEKDSDIDIYFEGVPKDRILSAVGHCVEVFSKHEIDLIPDAFCREPLRQKILREGIPLVP